ncbi:MAG: hypothetical protein SVV80_06100 [Planctomycetota bacterium]|nr:hypothetical protein [Planctomycetota bacterium]
MKKMIYPLLIAILSLGGCATSYRMAAPVADLVRSGLIDEPSQASRLEKAMTDGDIANLLDVNVRAKLPSGVAVAKIKSRCSGYQPYLDTIDAEELQEWEKAIGNQAHISGVSPVTSLTMAGHGVTLHTLRTAAARMNCELLLVYLQADSSVNNFNDAAVLYWTVIGLWTVPGDVVEHKTVMQAVLVDCRTGMILGTATGDAHEKRLCPAAFADNRKNELAEKVPAEALGDLQKGVGKLLKRVVETAVTKAE